MEIFIYDVNVKNILWLIKIHSKISITGYFMIFIICYEEYFGGVILKVSLKSFKIQIKKI